MNIKNYSFDHEKSREYLAKMIILHEYPLNIVEHHGFRNYSASLQPLFKVPSRNTIKSDILRIYDVERAKTLNLLEANCSRIALTIDMWTSSNQSKGLMAVTAHFIDENWTLQSRLMRFIYVPCPHTSKALADALLECMLDWNIDRKLSALTVDNCSTNDGVISWVLDKIPKNNLMLKELLFHVRCCAHILNLIVQFGMDVIGKSIVRVRDCVVFWTASPKREQKFEEAARQLGISSTKKLVLDCKTRWNSTYMMLATALIYKDVFYRLEKREALFDNLPIDEEWKLTQEVCEKLELFYSATKMFSGTRYPTSNVYFPKICEIRFALSSWLASSNEVIKKMAENMLEKYNKYWLNIHGIMGVAIILDPRYKTKLLTYCFKRIYGDYGYVDEVRKVQGYCYDLLEEYKARIGQGNDDYSALTSSSIDVGNRDFLGNFDEEMALESESSSVLVKSELDQYLEEKVLPRTKDFDILGWWKANGLKYPTLMLIARDILAIPISTVASESAFSTSGRLVTPHRSKLHQKTLEALMCAQSWLWNEITETCSEDIDLNYRSIEYNEDTNKGDA